MADRVHGRLAPATTQTIAGEDWDGDDLSGQTHDHVLFIDMDLSESTSSGGLLFDECTFRGVQFHRSVHTGASFTNCTFIDCRFFGATFVECKALGSMFDRCDFNRLTVRGGDWSFVGLPGADLRTVSFSDVRMREADLTGARVSSAEVLRVDLSGAMLGKTDFTKSDLRGSDLSAVDPFSVSLTGAIVDWNQAITLAGSLGLDVRPE